MHTFHFKQVKLLCISVQGQVELEKFCDSVLYSCKQKKRVVSCLVQPLLYGWSGRIHDYHFCNWTGYIPRILEHRICKIVCHIGDESYVLLCGKYILWMAWIDNLARLDSTVKSVWKKEER